MDRQQRDVQDYPNTPVDDAKNPEWSNADFASAKPFKDVFPEQFAALTRQGGWPRMS